MSGQDYQLLFKLKISRFHFCRLVDCSLELLADTCTNDELFEISQPDYLTVDMMKQVKEDLKC